MYVSNHCRLHIWHWLISPWPTHYRFINCLLFLWLVSPVLYLLTPCLLYLLYTNSGLFSLGNMNGCTQLVSELLHCQQTYSTSCIPLSWLYSSRSSHSSSLGLLDLSHVCLPDNDLVAQRFMLIFDSEFYEQQLK